MRIKLAVAAIAAAILAVGGVTLASAHSNGSSDGHGGKVIKLFAVTVQTEHIDLGAQGFSLGDEDVFSDDLFTKKGGTEVGVDGGVCTVVRVIDAKTPSGTAQCLVTASLPGGQITTQGLFTFTDQPPAPFQLAITGGTGAYKNARGQVTVELLSETEANYTLEVLTDNDD